MCVEYSALMPQYGRESGHKWCLECESELGREWLSGVRWFGDRAVIGWPVVQDGSPLTGIESWQR